ncbi:hypothetical protein L208DRAFT_1415124, partial [Tricholoma matsutake]
SWPDTDWTTVLFLPTTGPQALEPPWAGARRHPIVWYLEDYDPSPSTAVSTACKVDRGGSSWPMTSTG